jgi:branched-chain amino acid aminotransferase
LNFLNPDVAVRVHETPFTVGDMYKWSSEGRLLEAFGVGTAVVVAGVGAIGLEGHPDIDMPEYNGGLGPVAKSLHNRLTDIQEGKIDFGDWCYVCA